MKNYTNSGWKAQFISGVIMPLMSHLSTILAYVLISVVGGIFVTKAYITVGDIQAFIQYSRQFSQPIIQTANIANIIQSTVASAERVFELLDEEEEFPEAEDAKVISYPKGRVSFEHVTLVIRKNELLIKDMNIDVQPGQTIAIVGPTGAGKTTLLICLCVFMKLIVVKLQLMELILQDLKRDDLHKYVWNGTSRYLAV